MCLKSSRPVAGRLQERISFFNSNSFRMPSSTLSKSKASAAMTPSDHLSAFSRSVQALKQSGGSVKEKELEKVLRGVCAIEDISLGADRHLLRLVLFDANWLLSAAMAQSAGQQHVLPASLWTLLAAVNRWASRSDEARTFLRDKVRFLATLSRLLQALPATAAAQEKRSRLLDFMRTACAGIRIGRVEAFLADVVPTLLATASGQSASADARFSALFLLTSLCRGNASVAWFVLSQWSAEQRKALFSRGETAAAGADTDAKTEVLISYFNFVLSRSNLSSSAAMSAVSSSPAHDDNNVPADATMNASETQLVTLCEAFCAAYSDDDHLTLRLFNDFLGEAFPAKQATASELVALMQQVILVADFSHGPTSNAANEAALRFLRTALSLHPDPISELDLVSKALTARLEAAVSNPSLPVVETVGLFSDAVLALAKKWESGQLEGTPLQNVKFQLEPIASSLCELAFTDGGMNTVHRTSFVSAADALLALCRVDDVAAAIGKKLRPSTLLAKIDSALKTPQGHLPATAAVVLLIQELAKGGDQHGEEWTDCYQTLVSRRDLWLRLVACLQDQDCTQRDRNRVLTAICAEPKLTKSLIAGGDHDELVFDTDASADFVSPPPLTSGGPVAAWEKGDYEEVQNLLDSMKRTVDADADDLSHLLGDVLDLGDFRLGSQQRLLNNLNASLRLAKEETAQKCEQIAILEAELRETRTVLRNLCLKTQVSEQELRDVRAQYDKLHDDATKFRSVLTKETEEQAEKLEALAAEKDGLAAKAAKYKEQIGTLKEAIREHQKVQEDLQAKLKAEAKAQAELAAALEKREEKLRKKDRLLEEEQSRRERTESELDAARKEIASLQALTKRQEQALAKKEKQLTDQTQEMAQLRKIHDQIFSLSKSVNVQQK